MQRIARTLAAVGVLALTTVACSDSTATSGDKPTAPTTRAARTASTTTGPLDTTPTGDAPTVPSTPATAAASLCERVPAPLVDGLLGRSTTGVPKSAGPVSECVWRIDDDRVVAVIAGTGDLTEVLTTASSDDTVQERVDGVGDSAYYLSGFTSLDSATTSGLSLWVTRGDTGYVVSARTGDTPIDKAQLRAIAEELLG